MISSGFALINVILYSFGLSFFNNIYLSMFLAPAVLVFIQKEYLLGVLKKLLFLNVFIAVVSLSAYLNDDYNLALLLFLRANAILLFTLLIFSGKDLFSIASSLQTLKMPDKFVSLFFFVAKFIIIIKEEWNNTKKTLKVRHFKKRTSLHSYKIYANIIGMLIVKCFERASKLKHSMILRNFQGKIYQYKVEKITKLDFVIFVLVLLSVGLKEIKVVL